MSSRTRQVLAEVHAERIRQDELWGEQNKPDVQPAADAVIRNTYRTLADVWKEANDRWDNPHWDGIIQEEVYEALSEADPVRARKEWLQVAAVAVARVENLDRDAERRVATLDTGE